MLKAQTAYADSRAPTANLQVIDIEPKNNKMEKLLALALHTESLCHRFVCSHCESYSKQDNEYSNESDFIGSLFNCMHCERYELSEIEMLTHLIGQHADKDFEFRKSIISNQKIDKKTFKCVFECILCGHASFLPANIKAHFRNHHENRILDARILKCDDPNSQRNIYFREGYQCTCAEKSLECNKCFCTKTALLEHHVSHHPYNMLQFALSQPSIYVSNEASHQKYLYKCSFSGCELKFFFSDIAVRKHYEEKHSMNDDAKCRFKVRKLFFQLFYFFKT